MNISRIIDGKKYNTETADLIADYWNGRGGGDFGALSEELYLTKRGTWFLAYSGGALTYAAVSCGNNGKCGSKGIRPLSPEDAMEWLEEHAETEALETHFSDKIVEA
jgi:hypothetical protein